jgi:hypothetical protein
MPVNKRIAVGTEVSWVSRGAKKTGVIQAFVPSLANVRKVWDGLYPNKEFDWGAIGSETSSIPRYLVKVRLEIMAIACLFQYRLIVWSIDYAVRYSRVDKDIKTSDHRI